MRRFGVKTIVMDPLEIEGQVPYTDPPLVEAQPAQGGQWPEWFKPVMIGIGAFLLIGIASKLVQK